MKKSRVGKHTRRKRKEKEDRLESLEWLNMSVEWIWRMSWTKGMRARNGQHKLGVTRERRIKREKKEDKKKGSRI